MWTDGSQAERVAKGSQCGMILTLPGWGTGEQGKACNPLKSPCPESYESSLPQAGSQSHHALGVFCCLHSCQQQAQESSAATMADSQVRRPGLGRQCFVQSHVSKQLDIICEKMLPSRTCTVGAVTSSTRPRVHRGCDERPLSASPPQWHPSGGSADQTCMSSPLCPHSTRGRTLGGSEARLFH